MQLWSTGLSISRDDQDGPSGFRGFHPDFFGKIWVMAVFGDFFFDFQFVFPHPDFILALGLAVSTAILKSFCQELVWCIELYKIPLPRVL